MTARILVVDDDPETRGMIEAFLRSEGHDPILAADGAIALGLLDEARPDLVLLDAVMPGLDGFETCRLLKSDPRASDVPVIFMTGLSDSDHVVRGLEAGGVDYVTKPVVLNVLSARIRVHLGNSSGARKAMTGLDGMGAQLVSCDARGHIGWTTPAAQRVLDGFSPDKRTALQSLLAELIVEASQRTVTVILGAERFDVTLVGEAGSAEHMFRIALSREGREGDMLRDAFGLTPREADVLLWTARGKSNKDMSEILNISARTVNKHLEQIFVKIGVENRASAAAAATRVIYEA